MGDPASRLRQAFPLPGGDDAAVGQHSVMAEQAKPVVYVGVVPGLGEQRHRPADFTLSLVEMGVEIDPLVEVGAIKLPGQLELQRGACRGETGDDGVELPAAAVPLGHQFLSKQHGAFSRGVFQVFGQVAVLQHLPGDGAGVVAFRFLKQGIDRGFEGCGEDIGGCGSRREGLVEEHPGHLVGEVLVAESRLCRECVAVEPVNQCVAVRANHRGLHIVGMAVDESGQYERVLIPVNVGQARVSGGHVGVFTCGENPAVLYHGEAVGVIVVAKGGGSHGRVVTESEHRAAHPFERASGGIDG